VNKAINNLLLNGSDMTYLHLNLIIKPKK